MNAMTPFGAALLDYFRGNKDSVMIMHRDDGTSYELPVSIFFTESDSFSALEQKALEACRGNVLDAGAGTGKHSLYLKQNGFEVCPIDISSEVVEILKSKGLENAACLDIYDYDKTGFDTILMLGHGIGMAGTLAGFRKFLDHAEKILKPDGIVIFDSMDVRCTTDQKNLDYHERNRQLGRYIGEIGLQFEYNGILGEPHFWLHIDPDTLKHESAAKGWEIEILHKESTGDYLAKIWH